MSARPPASCRRAAMAGAVLWCAAALGGCAGPLATGAGGGTGARAGGRPFRVTAAVRQDFGVATGRDACSKEAQLGGGFGCFREDGLQYHGTPLPERTPSPTRLEVATTHVLAGLDYVVLDNLALGARAGLVVRGLGPRQDGAEAPAPLVFHGEARAAYWFGEAPLARDGLRWGVLVAGGIGQVDTAWQARVEEDTSKPPAAAQPHNPASQTLDVYRRSGTGFAGGGVTAAFGFAGRAAVFAEVMGIWLFPSDGAAISPVIGGECAF